MVLGISTPEIVDNLLVLKQLFQIKAEAFSSLIFFFLFQYCLFNHIMCQFWSFGCKGGFYFSEAVTIKAVSNFLIVKTVYKYSLLLKTVWNGF